ncbi:tetratricopeptide repeat protein [Vulcanimicrobium alpinum]|uniref:tetratricopeptide repeat protein n=1 Tax=Vulcanimicrobium alpinum TaxID=3016050 RepID=UPI00295ED890|nr:tetratricopeptide repeat protein [Vulcanimicrobium alpinum]
MALFDRLRGLLPGREAGPLDLGTRLIQRDRLDEAAAAFAEALAAAERPSDVARARNKLAIVAIRRGDRETAIAELIAAAEADPRSPAAITTLGNLLLEDGAIDEAIIHYEYAIMVDVDYAPAYHNFGVALHRSGRKREAVRMLRKATRLEGRR